MTKTKPMDPSNEDLKRCMALLIKFTYEALSDFDVATVSYTMISVAVDSMLKNGVTAGEIAEALEEYVASIRRGPISLVQIDLSEPS